MPITTGFNHVATMTPDLDRYIEFYSEVFGAKVIAHTKGWEGHPRMAIIHVGGLSELNVFEVDADSIIGERTAMGGRGPIDHFALMVDSEEALEGLRTKLAGLGSSPGEITDFGSALSVFFRDPDGMELEVVYHKPEFDPDSVDEPVEFSGPGGA